MPIYEYICNACGHGLEALQKLSDEPLKFCPECNEATLKKQVSAAAFRLKGTGWYETDFKNNGKKPPAEDSKPKSADKGNSAASSDTSAASSDASGKPSSSSETSESSNSASKSASDSG